MYYEKNGNHYLIYEHKKNQPSLPMNGWFHNCLFCNAITSNEEEFDYDKLNIKLLTCYNCEKNLEKELHRFKIITWIKKNIPHTKTIFC